VRLAAGPFVSMQWDDIVRLFGGLQNRKCGYSNHLCVLWADYNIGGVSYRLIVNESADTGLAYAKMPLSLNSKRPFAWGRSIS
jgi:hypothetical protein